MVMVQYTKYQVSTSKDKEVIASTSQFYRSKSKLNVSQNHFCKYCTDLSTRCAITADATALVDEKNVDIVSSFHGRLQS